MKKFESLKKNRDFGEVYQKGRSYGNRLLVMIVLDKGQDHPGRVGISVSKKVGNSVVRHRLKRQIREYFRLHMKDWKDGYDYVIIARKDAKDKDYQQIEKSLRYLGNRLQVYEEEMNSDHMPAGQG